MAWARLPTPTIAAMGLVLGAGVGEGTPSRTGRPSSTFCAAVTDGAAWIRRARDRRSAMSAPLAVSLRVVFTGVLVAGLPMRVIALSNAVTSAASAVASAARSEYATGVAVIFADIAWALASSPASVVSSQSAMGNSYRKRA